MTTVVSGPDTATIDDAPGDPPTPVRDKPPRNWSAIGLVMRKDLTAVKRSKAIMLPMILVPAVLLFPVKLLALWLIHQGRAALGLVVIVVAKIVGTALVGRLFMLTEPKLMQFAWFARALAWWRTTKARVKAIVRASAAWRGAQALRRRVRIVLRRFAGRH